MALKILKASPATRKSIRRLGLTYITTDELTIRRLRHGNGFRYVSADGTSMRGEETRRLASLAVPPAYEDVLYASDPSAHIQATGRDAAGRLQYRYHPDWLKVREIRKARRIARLAVVMPQIRRSIGRHLAAGEATRAFTLSAVIELVARSAIRPGNEEYARLRGTRGAATLLKSNVTVYGETIYLCFRAKGGKRIEKEVYSPRLATAVAVLHKLPGRRLFQYRTEDGALRQVNAQDVNRFLRDIAGVEVSLKDFLHVLLASISVLEALGRTEPATSKRARRRHVFNALFEPPPTIWVTRPPFAAKATFTRQVVNAFEEGALEQFADLLRGARSPSRSEKVLVQVTDQVATDFAA